MKTFVGLFAASAAFGAAIALAYFFVAHEEAAGTALLGIMTAALALCAGYALIAERNADLDGDRAGMTPASAAGEDLGVFTTHSAWPVLTALSLLGILVGVIWSPLLGVLALAGLIVCLWRMGAESARV